MKIDILGETYEMTIVDYGTDDHATQRNLCGYCDNFENKIVIVDLNTYDEFKSESSMSNMTRMCRTMRHEIIHAFLFESGLDASSCETQSWALNEEMVDFFALQWHKIEYAIAEALEYIFERFKDQ